MRSDQVAQPACTDARPGCATLFKKSPEYYGRKQGNGHNYSNEMKMMTWENLSLVIASLEILGSSSNRPLYYL